MNTDTVFAKVTKPREAENLLSPAPRIEFKPLHERRVVVLAEMAWEGLFLATTLQERGVNLAAVIVGRGPTDGILGNPRRWYRARQQVGWSRSVGAFLGLPFGLGYALRRLVNRREYPLPKDLKRMGIPIEWVDDFRKCHDGLRRLEPDVAVICGTPILPESILSIPKICTINIHTSLLPFYRGGGSRFWPLFFRDTGKVGFTIHRADAALDAGPFLCQGAVSVGPQDSPSSLLRKCFLAAAPKLAHILKTDPLNEQSWHEYQKPVKYVFRNPPPLLLRECGHGSLVAPLKRIAKEAIHTVRMMRLLPRRREKSRFVALSCHRALCDQTPSDDWRRVLGHQTVSELRKRLIYLQKRFTFVSLSRWLELISSNEPLDRDYIVLTVDDGYRDFLTGLLPLLQKLNLPAAFFVCTGAVETGSIWYQVVYNLIDQISSDRLRVPWMDTEIYFGDTRQRILTIEHALLPYLKRLSRVQREESVRELITANNASMLPSQSDMFCSLADLQALKESPLVELYPHSHNHDPFDSLSDDELKADLTTCKRFFLDRLGLRRDVISYPNARLKERQRILLKDEGFRFGFTQTNGFDVRGSLDPLALRRNSIGPVGQASFLSTLYSRDGAS